MNSVTLPNTMSKNILLTGAGFTHNFGGFLAKDMWYKIHNDLTSSNYKNLIELIKNTESFDYEEFYEEVISDNKYNKNEKDACTDSILNTYKKMDINIYDSYKAKLLEDNHICLEKLSKFLSLFGMTNSGNISFGSSKEPGFFFTLNQDLFIERFCPIVQPGFPNWKRLYYDSASNGYPNPENLKEIPAKEQLEIIKQTCWGKELYYIKLHGSLEWRKQGALVIGTKKMDRIKDWPILDWYYQLFERVLSSGGQRLVIIGYGFRDEHINKVILDSIKENGLIINIICPTENEKFKMDTLEKHFKKEEAVIIWKAIVNYYKSSLEEFFPFNRDSQDYDHLCNYLRN